MLSWSCPHTSWQLSLILFSWASVQMLPLLSLQHALTLLWYFLQAVCMDTSSVSEHEMQSSEAVSKLESATFSLDELESSEAWSPVLHRLPAAVPSSGSMKALVGLEGGLVGSCPHCSKLGPASSTNLGMFSSCHAELCSILTSTSWELTWVLLPKRLLSESLWEQSHFFCEELAADSKKGHTMGECPQRGDLAREVLGEEKFQLGELDCSWGPEQVILLAWVQQLGHSHPVM